MCEFLNFHGVFNMIFAAAPSQNEFLSHLIHSKQIDWSRINAFHICWIEGNILTVNRSCWNRYVSLIVDNMAFWYSCCYVNLIVEDDDVGIFTFLQRTLLGNVLRQKLLTIYSIFSKRKLISIGFLPQLIHNMNAGGGKGYHSDSID